MKKLFISISLLFLFILVGCKKNNNEDFRYELNSDGTGYIVYGANLNSGDIKISEKYNNLPVVGIGDDAFKNYNIVRLDLSECSNLTYIGNNAFNNCDELLIVTLPNDIKSIGEYAFYSCDKLQSVNFDELYELSNIEKFAFSGCTSLRNLYLSDTKLEVINEDCFSNCQQLSAIELPNVREIKDHAFYKCSLGYVNEFPMRLENIGESAFFGLQSSLMTTLRLSSSIKTIGDKAFAECSFLKEVDLSLSTNLEKIGDKAFYRCLRLTTFKLNSDILDFKSNSYCFYEAGKSLSNGITLYLLDNVTNISKYMFNCDNQSLPRLRNIVLNNNILSIPEDTFKVYDQSLTYNIYYMGNEDEYNNIVINASNNFFNVANVYYYSLEEPTTAGNYWHYDSNNKPVIYS